MVPKQNGQAKAEHGDMFDFIDGLITWSEQECREKPRRQKISLYTEGLRGKLRQAQFAIQSMNNLSLDPDPSSSDKDFSALDKVHFYSDAFWALGYASLDIAAQIINQSENLQLDEHSVSFKAVCERLDSNSPIRHEMERIQRKNFFRNRKRYRHCCLHRRSIYIREETHTVTHTPGYEVSQTDDVVVESVSMTKGGRTQVTGRRILCDNPLALTPSTSQNREIIEYCSKSFQHLRNSLKELFTVVLA